MTNVFNIDEDYSQAMDRSHTIDSILALDKRFARKYLNTRTLDSLHELEDSLLNQENEISKKVSIQIT